MPYRLYLDEVGHDDLAHVHDEGYRYLSLSGVIMDQDYVRDVATPAMNAFKSEVFQHDPEEIIILHRKDIMQKKGPFGILRDPIKLAYFDEKLLGYLTNTQYSVITVMIDKQEMMKQYHWMKKHPYHYLMEILVEKYTRWLIRHDSVGDIMPEERKGQKDKDLQREYTTVRIMGTSYVLPSLIKERIPANKLKFRNKQHNVTGLQICDLVAYPSHAHIRQREGHTIVTGPFSEKVIPILRNSKYDRSANGYIPGYGIKYLP
jgi:hypothetical protein